MTPLLIALPGNEALTAQVAAIMGADTANVEIRRFPDEETYLRVLTPVTSRSVAIVCTLDRPDRKFLPLAFAAATLRELGAKHVGLVAPYLAYMRQDSRFQSGEAVTSRAFAKLVSETVDWIVTIDPHLHRISSLSSLYSIPAQRVHAAPLLADWIREFVVQPVLVGPDAESAQWVSEVAALAKAPFVILEKKRRSDTEVDVAVPDVSGWRNHTPVLVDDIISTARTMIATLHHLERARMKPAVCVGVHAVFAPGAYDALIGAGCSRIVTTNSIVHETNAINIAKTVGDAVSELL